MDPEPSLDDRPAPAARRVTRNASLLAGADLASKLALLVLFAIAARELGKSGFGDLTLAIALVFLIQVSSFGTDLIVTRTTARSHDEVHDVFWNAIAIKLGLGIPAYLGIIGLGLVLDYGGDLVAAIALIGAAGLVDAVAFTAHATLRGREEMGPPAAAIVIERGLTAVLSAFALIALDAGLAAVGAIYLFSAIVSALFIGVALRRRITPERRLGRTRLRTMLRSAIPLGVASVLALALARIDTIILAVLIDSDAVGLYGAAYRLFEAPIFLITAFAAAMYPMISRLDRGTSPTVGRVFELSWMVLLAITVPFGALMIAFPSTLVEGVFGSSFDDAVTATRLLGYALLVYPTVALSWQTLIAQDRERQLVVGVGATVALNVILNFALIPEWSLDGAAAAMGISLVVSTAILLTMALRVVGRVSPVRVFSAPLAALAAMLAIGLWMGDDVVSMLVASAVYLAVLAAVELTLHREDLFQFLGSLRGGGSAAPLGDDPVV